VKRPFVLAILLFVASHLVWAQPRPTSTSVQVTGRVMDTRDGVPLRRVRVGIAAGRRELDAVFTDDAGRFVLSVSADVELTLRVSKAGYAPEITAIRAGRTPEPLDIALSRSAAVMGRVLDGSGAPVVGAYVTGRRVSGDVDAAPLEVDRFFAQTDPLGEYRLGGLPAGAYEIVAGRIPPERRFGGSRIEDLLFGAPDALDLIGEALKMNLTMGEEVHGLEFRLPGSADACPTGPSVRLPDGGIAGSVTGRVSASTGEPLACAIVRVRPNPGVPQVYTDEQGRYEIAGLPAGSFLIEARRLHHHALVYGQRHPSDPEASITLREGQRREDVDIVLPRESLVGGTVRDEYGEPVEGVTVYALQLRRFGETVATRSSALPVRTDDRGRFQLAGVSPGTHLLAASARHGIGGIPGERFTGYVTSYSPGTTNPMLAHRVSVDAGIDARDLDVVLVRSDLATVTGMLLDASGQPYAGSIDMSVSRRSGAVSIDSWSASAGPDGQFTIRNVPPGDYVVKSTAPSGTGFGMQYASVVDGDAGPVTVRIADGAVVQGTLVMRGAGLPDARGITVSAFPTNADLSPLSSTRIALFSPTGQSPTASMLEGGTFRIPGVIGPNRLLVATPTCEDCYVESVILNGADVTDTAFDFGVRGGLFRGAEIVVSDAGGAIEGRVTDDRGEPGASFAVLVFSTKPELRHPLSRHVKSQSNLSSMDGTYRVTGLPPGEYYVAAVNRVEQVIANSEESDGDLLEQFSARARRVTITERTRETLDLRLIRR
jgi:hypothetical protein